MASHGNYDEEGLAGALMSDAPYVALVASRKRAESVVQYLRETGMPPDRLTRLKYPAGLDIGAVTPGRDRVEHTCRDRSGSAAAKRAGTGTTSDAAQEPAVEQGQQVEAIDPVCGMTVEIATARYTTEYAGQTYYFCAARL